MKPSERIKFIWETKPWRHSDLKFEDTISDVEESILEYLDEQYNEGNL